MRNLIVCTCVALLAFAGPVSAQSTSFGLGAFAGVSMPMGDFGETEGAEAGGAELGFVGGLDLFYPLGMNGALSWLTTASVSAHSVEEADAGYLMIPLLTGVRYDVAAGPVGVFLTGQGGVVFNKGPEAETTLGTVNSDWGTDFGFGFGGGVQATQNIYAGVKYLPLGDIEFSYEDGAGSFTQNVSVLEIFVGFGVR